MERRKLAIVGGIVAVAAVVVILLAVLLLGNQTNSGNQITLSTGEKKTVHIDGQDVNFTYVGSGSLHVAVVLPNGYEDSGLTFAVEVDQNWSSFQSGHSGYWNWDIDFHYRAVQLTADGLTLELKDI